MLFADKGQMHYMQLHVFSGAVGKFNQLGKAMWLKIFRTSGIDKIGALEQLLTVNETSEQLAMLVSFVCEHTAQKALRSTAFLNSVRSVEYSTSLTGNS